MVVEKSVLMKVVFPRPDSPATCDGQNEAAEMQTGRMYHYSEGSAALCNNLVPVLR
jgi:hypothetical protein